MLRAVIALLVLLIPSVTQAEGRFALLIGNQAYNPKVGPLKNPHDDIALVGAALRSIGFAVTEVRDADYRSMDAAIKRHAATVRREGQGTISLFYYSGHGAADADTKTNYLIPVDVADADDADLWNYSLNLNNIVEGLRAQAPAATHYVVFDACRNELNLIRKGKKALTDKGFVPLAYTPGVMVAYATAPGQTAADSGGGGGPNAKALADEIVKPGIEAMTMFRRVALRVNREMGQDPWMSASTLPEVYFAGAPTAGGNAAPTGETAEAWEAARETSDPAVLEAFISRFKDSFYADLPRSRLKQLKDARAAMAAPSAPPSPARPSASCDGIEITVGQSELRCFKPGAGKTEHFKDCPACPEMVVVPAGTFTMGSPADEPQRETGEDQVRVTISAPFAVGKYAVTFDEWDACVAEGGCNGYKPGDEGWGRGKHPVINVSWDDAKTYTAWLARKSGKTYRLLSEAEREYVTRAGTTTQFWWGFSITPTQARYTIILIPSGFEGADRMRTAPVDSFEGNPWGLYNVHGNVSEWTEDCWNDSNARNPGDGSARTTGDCSRRVVRGGSWLFPPLSLRSANRASESSSNRSRLQGFRMARTLAP
jgi:formylglycine-generating enzyme required for sulfatase activity